MDGIQSIEFGNSELMKMRITDDPALLAMADCCDDCEDYVLARTSENEDERHELAALQIEADDKHMELAWLIMFDCCDDCENYVYDRLFEMEDAKHEQAA